jgi:hypothetical protein
MEPIIPVYGSQKMKKAGLSPAFAAMLFLLT